MLTLIWQVFWRIWKSFTETQFEKQARLTPFASMLWILCCVHAGMHVCVKNPSIWSYTRWGAQELMSLWLGCLYSRQCGCLNRLIRCLHSTNLLFIRLSLLMHWFYLWCAASWSSWRLTRRTMLCMLSILQLEQTLPSKQKIAKFC